MGKVIAALLLLVGISLSLNTGAAEGADRAQGKADDHAMHLHHMHTLMDHSLIMVLEGSNLLMFSRMHGSEQLASLLGEHGKEMIAEGKGTLKAVLSGEEMQAAHQQGRWNEPLMGYTHELGAEILAVVDDLEKMDVGDAAAHQRQMVLNHALQMAAEGSNLVMLGKMRMAGSFDQRTEAHGRHMIADARTVWQKVAGESVKGAQPAKGVSPAESFVRHGGKVLTLLGKMSALQ